MSNTWSYNVILSSENPLSDQVLTATTETLNMMNYSIWNPVFHKITGMSSDGWHELEFNDWEAAQTHLVVHGGLITCWNTQNGLDIGLAIVPDDREIGLFVLHDLSSERHDDVEVAADLRSLFAALCRRLGPVYGYSTDEYRLETAYFGGEIYEMLSSLRMAVEMLDPPPALFWLNYFSRAYFDRIPKPSLLDLLFREETAGQGFFVFLSEYPWNARMARLQPSGKYMLV